jgi:hypothetical protein
VLRWSLSFTCYGFTCVKIAKNDTSHKLFSHAVPSVQISADLKLGWVCLLSNHHAGCSSWIKLHKMNDYTKDLKLYLTENF